MYRYHIYICVSQLDQPPAAFTVVFYQEANQAPSHAKPTDAVLPALTFSHLLTDCPQNIFPQNPLHYKQSPLGRHMGNHARPFIPVLGSLQADWILLQVCQLQEPNSLCLPRAPGFSSGALGKFTSYQWLYEKWVSLSTILQEKWKLCAALRFHPI